jgi:integrase
MSNADTTRADRGAPARHKRQSTGGIVERETSRGRSFAIRFRAGGQRQFQLVGYEHDGATRADAERELAYTLEQVRRGEWKPPAMIELPRTVPTFHEFASEWYARREHAGLRPRTLEHLRWCLTDHLLPAFRTLPLDRIDAEGIDRFTARKRRAGLSASSVNRLVQVLAAVLEDALEYELTNRNAAASRRRRLATSKPRRTYLDRADHIAALLDAAGELDGERRGVPFRRALIATLTLGGLRIGECLDLRWRDVELANGRLLVARSKTAAGERTVDLLPALRDELAGLAAIDKGDDLDAFVFATSTGCRRTTSNARQRVFRVVVERANARLAEHSIEPLPDRLTPHSLRRTFASLLYALGETPPRVMAQMGHTSPQLALAIYAREMDRRDGEPERLRALVGGTYRALTGTEVASPAATDLGEVVA